MVVVVVGGWWGFPTGVWGDESCSYLLQIERVAPAAGWEPLPTPRLHPAAPRAPLPKFYNTNISFIYHQEKKNSLKQMG